MPAAFGVRIKGAPPTPWLAARDAGNWPVMTIERQADSLSVDASTLRAAVPSRLPLDELIHPVLPALATAVALAHGHDGLHAGALCGRSGVWAVVGPKAAGKSTLLAACASSGLSVFTDDVLLFDGARCFAGPRCLDLRADAARAYGGTLRVRRATPRRRLTLPVVDAELPLAGFVHLAWGHGPKLVPLSVSEALRALTACYSTGGFTRRPERLLELSGLPSYALCRPRDHRALPATAALLRRQLALG